MTDDSKSLDAAYVKAYTTTNYDQNTDGSVTVYLDVYNVYDLFDVKSHRLAHALKKLLAPGQRGAKSARQDLQEAVLSIQKAIEEER